MGQKSQPLGYGLGDWNGFLCVRYKMTPQQLLRKQHQRMKLELDTLNTRVAKERIPTGDPVWNKITQLRKQMRETRKAISTLQGPARPAPNTPTPPPTRVRGSKRNLSPTSTDSSGWGSSRSNSSARKLSSASSRELEKDILVARGIVQNLLYARKANEDGLTKSQQEKLADHRSFLSRATKEMTRRKTPKDSPTRKKKQPRVSA